MRYRTVHEDAPRPQTEGDAISRQLDAITLEDHLDGAVSISRETVRTFLSPVEGGGYGLGPDVCRRTARTRSRRNSRKTATRR